MARSRSRSRRAVGGRRRPTSLSRLSGYFMFYGVLATALVSGVTYGYKTLLDHPFFAVKELQVSGASSRTEAELRQTLSPLAGRNIFTLDMGDIRTTVSQHPLVETVAVQGKLPDTLSIHLEERQPAGLVRLDNQILVVGQDGETIADFNRYEQALDFPVIEGVGKTEDLPAAIRHGLAVLTQIKQSSLLFWDNIDTLNLADEENMIVRLRNEEAPIYLGSRVIAANLNHYLSIANHLTANYTQLAYIELGFPNQVAILPKHTEK